MNRNNVRGVLSSQQIIMLTEGRRIRKKACKYMRGANLQGEKHRDVDFSGCDLRDANLSNADLRDSDFTNANLTDADLRGACLNKAIFEGTDLSEARLEGHLQLIRTTDEGINVYLIKGTDYELHRESD
jgi:uncharacterized protein YjbI with pentapeptide repeats